MLSIKPIQEADVIDLINNGRFDGEIEGYIIMEGEIYLGHALFKIDEKVTTVLDSEIEDELNLDGTVRACIAAGANRGAGKFLVNKKHPPLAKWWDKYCKNIDGPVETGHIFSFC